MAMKLAQGTRAGFLKTKLGEDKLGISNFEGAEGLSELFEFRIEAFSDSHNLDFDPAIGTNCSISIHAGYKGVTRVFNGVLVEAQWTGKSVDELSSYRLVLRPWLWLLTRTTNCRIFSEKSALDIILQVLHEHPFAKVEPRTTRSYPVLEYCVQYRESDLQFVSRLMEEFGIYYFFDHSESDHKMILADSASGHLPKLGGAALSYYDDDLRGTREEDAINQWSDGRHLRSGKIRLNDYDYKKPTADLVAKKAANVKYSNGDLELYDYPGRYIEKSDGETLANVRLEVEQAQDRRSTAVGDAVTCCPGNLIKLAKHPVGAVNKEYVIVRANHMYRSNAYRSGPASEDETYVGRYEFQPSDVQFRASARTPKPVIYGPQTAVVVSEVDEQCRIKVRFFWDKEASSRYVRIGHPWASKKWGNIKIPRIDMEVIVEFLEGDPDYPLVVGTVYNDDNKTPYPLPEDKSISGVKSQSIGASGYNEFILDDRGGNELIRMHAQRDMEALIEHDERREIKNDVTVKVGHNRKENIGSTWTVEAGEKIEFIVGQSKITMDPTSITLKSINITVQSDVMLTLKSSGTADLTAGAMLTIKGALVTIN
jgi:type VI secretion system secreted protein VgrG